MHPIAQLANPWIAALPVYEPGRPIEEVARELDCSPDDIRKLASNENALGPSPLALEAMRRAAADMHRYPDGGAFYLRRKLAGHLGVTPDQIAVGNGSNEILELLGHCFLAPGAHAVMAQGAFIVYDIVAAAAQAEVTRVPMRELTHDLDAMLDAVTPHTRLVFVANPNNPTGTMVDKDSLRRFLDRLPAHVIAVLDEAYIEMLDPAVQPDTIGALRDGRPVVVARTFSKIYGLAGLRIGYAVAHPDIIGMLNRVRAPFNVNAMALAAAEAALDDNDYVERTRRLVADGLAFFERELRRLDVPFVPSVANFLLVRVGDGAAVFRAMLERKVIVRPVAGYGLPEYVRITVGTEDENRRCVDALADVLARRSTSASQPPERTAP